MSSGYLTHHQQAPDAPQFDLPTTNSPRSQLARRKGSKTRERVRSLIVTYAWQPVKPCEHPWASCEPATLKRQESVQA